MVKVTIDRAQSGGDCITVTNDENKILVTERIHLLPEKDGNVIFDNNKFESDIKKK